MRTKQRALGDAALKPKQLAALRLLTLGFTNKAIALEIGLAGSSVQKMLSHQDDHRAIFPRIGVAGKMQAVRWYFDFQQLFSMSGLPVSPSLFPPHYSDRLDGCTSLANDICSFPLYAVGRPLLSPSDLAEILQSRVNAIYQMGVQGYPLYARQMGIYLATLIQNVAVRSASGAVRRALDRGYVHTLYEIARTFLESCPAELIIESAGPIPAAMRRIAEAYQDAELAALADLIWGYITYVAGKYGIARNSLVQALEGLKEPDDRLQAVRGLAVIYAHLGREREFLESEMITGQLISEGHVRRLDYVVEAFEGTGRGRRLLHLTGGLETLECGQVLYDHISWEAGEPIFRYIQYGRAWAQTADPLERKDGRIVSTIQEASHLAHELGFVRYDDIMRQ